jgi:hypothetical protein
MIMKCVTPNGEATCTKSRIVFLFDSYPNNHDDNPAPANSTNLSANEVLTRYREKIPWIAEYPRPQSLCPSMIDTVKKLPQTQKELLQEKP